MRLSINWPVVCTYSVSLLFSLGVWSAIAWGVWLAVVR